MPKVIALLLLAGILSGCASIPAPPERRASADALAAAKGWRAAVISAGKFQLLTYAPQPIREHPDLTVYIEGDGFAWLTGSTPSSDPTPRDPLALRLALAHPKGNAAYLARPCQYVDELTNACAQRYWTTARFAPEAIEASSKAVDQLKIKFGATRLVLVGYSGGAAVAALLAARRGDVDRLITVAGNLDHRAWTAFHRVTPLTGSLNAADESDKLASLPQTHFVGGRDRVIPPDLAHQWPHSMLGPGGKNLHVIAEFDHACCWAEGWKERWSNIWPERNER